MFIVEYYTAMRIKDKSYKFWSEINKPGKIVLFFFKNRKIQVNVLEVKYTFICYVGDYWL